MLGETTAPAVIRRHNCSSSVVCSTKQLQFFDETPLIRVLELFDEATAGVRRNNGKCSMEKQRQLLGEETMD